MVVHCCHQHNNVTSTSDDNTINVYACSSDIHQHKISKVHNKKLVCSYPWPYYSLRWRGIAVRIVSLQAQSLVTKARPGTVEVHPCLMPEQVTKLTFGG